MTFSFTPAPFLEQAYSFFAREYAHFELKVYTNFIDIRIKL